MATDIEELEDEIQAIVGDEYISVINENTIQLDGCFSVTKLQQLVTAMQAYKGQLT